MSRVLRSTILVTLFTIVGQLINFAAQIIVAYLFGAGAEIDAFNTAIILPQYINYAILGSLGFVFLPVFVEYFSSGREEAAWRVASSVLNFSLLFLVTLSILGILFSDPILQATAPGLPDPTRALAVQLQVILWPSVVATGITVLLTGIYHSQGRFGWPAFVPILGGLFSLLVMLMTEGRLGVTSYAIAITVGSFLQALLLAGIVFGAGRFHFVLDWRHPGIKELLKALIPLLLASMFGKATGLVERFLASSMPEGSISHLSYALRLVSVLALFFSSGVGAVFFQRMAIDVSSGNMLAFRRTLSVGIRFLWIAVAPVAALTIVLALPAVSLIFERGQFGHADVVSVSRLLQIYILSLAPACIGNVTARGFYATKDTRTLAIMVALESFAYVVYTFLLARAYGPQGIALGYVILFNVSLLWQALIMAARTGKMIGLTVLSSLLKTSVAAFISGLAAWKAIPYIDGGWLQLLIGGTLGLLVYALVLLVLRPREVHELKNLLTGPLNRGIA